ncbi:hypothetical protein LZ32DRAFT_326031 [Colletotrichum eremochloae]|nr:hypothetical protein LZ32DRAFT_326031 [Colletotrichum eremochloae]
MKINIVASNEKESISYILARKPEARNFLLYSKSAFNHAFGDKAGDHVINTRRLITGQEPLRQKQKKHDIPHRFLEAQGYIG